MCSEFLFLVGNFSCFRILLPSIQMTEITKSTADTKYNNATITERFFGCSRYLPFLRSFFVKSLQKKAHTFSSFLLTQSFEIDAISIQMA